MVGPPARRLIYTSLGAAEPKLVRRAVNLDAVVRENGRHSWKHVRHRHAVWHHAVSHHGITAGRSTTPMRKSLPRLESRHCPSRGLSPSLPQQGTVPLNDTWRVGDSPRASWGQSPSLGRVWVGDSPRVWVWVEFGLGTVPEFGLYRARNVPVWAMGLNFDSKTRGLTDADYERLA